MANVGEERPDGQSTSKICPGPVVPGHTLQYYEDQHAWVIDQVLLPCSAPEYHCLQLLLERANRCVPFAHFLICLQTTPTTEHANLKQERMRIAHLMSVLRTKIWPFGLDIASVMNIGYILLSEGQETPASP